MFFIKVSRRAENNLFVFGREEGLFDDFGGSSFFTCSVLICFAISAFLGSSNFGGFGCSVFFVSEIFLC
jgi:hypothetical protein